MEIITKQTPEALVIQISGAVDSEAAEKLRHELSAVSTRNPSNVVMDLSRVPSIGSSGIGKILIFYKELNKKRVSFEIKGIHDNVYNIFKAIKLDKLFPISLR